MEPRAEWPTESQHRLWILNSRRCFRLFLLRVFGDGTNYEHLLASLILSFNILLFYGQRFAIPPIYFWEKPFFTGISFSLLRFFGTRGFGASGSDSIHCTVSIASAATECHGNSPYLFYVWKGGVRSRCGSPHGHVFARLMDGHGLETRGG